MKLLVKNVLQRLLGLENYLFFFSLFKIATLKCDAVEGNFLYLLSMIGDNGLVIDAGANIGIMSVLLAKKVSQGQVYAFEPMPVNFKVLGKVIKWFRLDNVIIYPWALGSIEQEVEMVMPVVGAVRLQGLSHIIDENNGTVDSGDRARVICKRLDDIPVFFEPGARITALKIDVEGFEYFVLEGGQKLLSTHRPVIYCEIGSADSFKRCATLLNLINYDIKVLADNKLQPYDSQKHDGYWNFFLIPR